MPVSNLTTREEGERRALKWVETRGGGIEKGFKNEVEEKNTR